MATYRAINCPVVLTFFLLHFRFWDTCEEHSILLHRYTHGIMVFCLHSPVTYTWHFSLCYPSPTSLSPAVSSQVPPQHLKGPSVWCSPLCIHVFSLFNTHLWVRTCGVWFSVLVSVCWEWCFTDSSMSLQRTWTLPLLWLHSIPRCICATFSLSSLSLMGIWVSSKSLLLWTVLQWIYVCMCLYNRSIYNPLGIYQVMGLLGQMVFLFLGPWGITTLSSTMVAPIYTPTNSVKHFCLSVSSLESVISWFFNDHHFNWHEIVSQCGFGLHFSNDWWWWVFFSCLWAT